MARGGEAGSAGKANLRSPSLVELAHDDLELQIASGALAPGARLVLGRLAEQFGTSQIPIREALVRLHAERLVEFEPRKGYRVAPGPDAREMDELFRARLILETGAVEWGHANVTDATIMKLRTINTALEEINPGSDRRSFIRFIRQNELFHRVLVGLANNSYISDAYDRLGYHQRIVQSLYTRGVPDKDRIVGEHEEIITALSSGVSSKSTQAVRDHITGGYARHGGLGDG